MYIYLKIVVHFILLKYFTNMQYKVNRMLSSPYVTYLAAKKYVYGKNTFQFSLAYRWPDIFGRKSIIGTEVFVFVTWGP